MSDPALVSIEAAVERLRAEPGRFADIGDAALQLGMSESRLTRLCQKHYHSTPDELLLRARLEAAKSLLLAGSSDSSVVARKVGFESVKFFSSQFVRYHGLTPTDYRELRNARSFSVRLPPGYPLNYLRRALGRDTRSACESLVDSTYMTAFALGDGALVVTMNLTPERIDVSLSKATKEASRVHAVVAGMLGLGQPTEALVELARRAEVERLVSACPQLRVHQTPSVYDGLLWTIIGQQINLPFAFSLRRRLVMLAGTRISEDFHAFPTPEAVANLEPRDLLPHQYSRQKADYVVSISRLVAEGRLDLEGLRTMSATRAEQTLLGVRGLGPWSVHYIMMRSLGFGDCLPLGDTGVTSSLWSLFETRKRPDVAATRRLMAPFSPYRSLATAHLWQWGKSIPE